MSGKHVACHCGHKSSYSQDLPKEDLLQRLSYYSLHPGGALAVLVCTLARLRLHFPASQLQCFTFGSPCVLASAADSTRSAIQVGRAADIIGIFNGMWWVVWHV